MDDFTKGQLEQMDEDALEAREELELHLQAWQATDVAAWWKRWYTRAGHKRLGRILVDLARKFEEEKSWVAERGYFRKTIKVPLLKAINWGSRFLPRRQFASTS